MSTDYPNTRKDIKANNMEENLLKILKDTFGKTSFENADDREIYYSVLILCKNLMGSGEIIKGKKKVYYISAEFLVGRLLDSNLINLGVRDELSEILSAHGKDLTIIEECEKEPSLGNGGLGRLAACFMDSIAALDLPGEGIGLNYHFGLFKQVFKDNLQNAEKDEWIEKYSWLEKTDVTYDVLFGDAKVKSRLYNMHIAGYNGGVNMLRLFDVESIDESLVKKGIDFDKEAIEKNLTLFLYPDDSDEAGNLLRIYQQYFMVSNGARLIIDELKSNGTDLRYMNEAAVIQINDTHPTMVIPELIRILTKEEGMGMDEAIDVVSRTCAYTNHTILSEALEKWPLEYLEKVVPALIPIIKELHVRAALKYRDKSVRIIKKLNDRWMVHMAHICIHYGFSINGVAAIHTDILKNTELAHFYKIYPEKFNNKTNGITFRRWLLSCNKELTSYLDSLIGSTYKKNADDLEKLLEYIEDDRVLDSFADIKRRKKEELSAYVYQKEGIKLNPDSIFDIQVKRLHEYKRQQMNALYIIHKYLEIKKGKLPKQHVTYIFGAKAAPAYVIARDIIHLILVLQRIINKDPVASKYMTVVMVENYNVSYAEKLIPACDISEQISLASKEASGTGNMKFMLNGAITLGTDDGANVEIHELVGDDNIYIFGAKADVVIDHYKNEDYISRDIYKKSAVVKEAVDFITGKEALAVGKRANLKRLSDELLKKDYFMTLLDLEDYIKVKDQCIADYSNRRKWKQMMLTNTAKAGFFSSDRTIAQYEKDIWHLR